MMINLMLGFGIELFATKGRRSGHGDISDVASSAESTHKGSTTHISMNVFSSFLRPLASWYIHGIFPACASLPSTSL